MTFGAAVPNQGICNQASGTVICTLGSINSGASATVTITVIYTVTVTNNGLSQATGVVLSDTLPANVTFGSASSSQGSCSEAPGTVTCTLGTINNGANASDTITVIPTLADGGTTITNTAVAASGVNDPSLANNAISESTTVTEAVTPPGVVTPVPTPLATPFPELTVVPPENIKAPLPDLETLAVVRPTTPAAIELPGQGVKLDFPAPVQPTTFLARLKILEPVSLTVRPRGLAIRVVQIDLFDVDGNLMSDVLLWQNAKL